jgi:hypothetical protein
MLIAGIVNPPPITDPAYTGVYLSEKDDMPAQARALANKPLRVEHGDVEVGRVLNGWQDKRTGALCALAEIDVSKLPGALAAAAVTQGRFGQFSLGYSTRITQSATRTMVASDKRILELSLVKQGARPNCHIAVRAHHHHHPYAKTKKAEAPAPPPPPAAAPGPVRARDGPDCLAYWSSAKQ